MNGRRYDLVESHISWDNDMIDSGKFAVSARDGSLGPDPWVQVDASTPEWKALVPALKSLGVRSGTWTHVTVPIYTPPGGQPALRMAAPELLLIKQRMVALAQATRPGEFFPSVKVPVDLAGVRGQMLAYGNVAHDDPEFRKTFGSKTTTDLTPDVVATPMGQKPMFKASPTPPYFPDQVLNDRLSRAAQFQAEYIASMNRGTHDGPATWRDPATGKTHAMLTPGARAQVFGWPNRQVVELAGMGSASDQPHNWIVADTMHFTPFFEIDGSYPEIGYGAAQASDGTWWFAAVVSRLAKPSPSAATQVAQASPPPAAPAPPRLAAPVPPPAPVGAPAAPAAPAGLGLLSPGEAMLRGSNYTMEGHYVSWQRDGNLCVYTNAGGWVWCINNDPTVRYQSIAEVELTTGGQFRATDASGQTVWQAPPGGSQPGAGLYLTRQGALQVRAPSGGVLWSSK